MYLIKNKKMKLKYLIILAVMFISTAGFSQEKLNLKAFYLGFNKEYQAYLFEGVDGVTIEFTKVDNAVLKEYDLLSPKFIDQAFSITYTVKVIDEDEDYSEVYTIVLLKPTVLEKTEDLEYEEEE
jgi:hypothetical protein